MSMFEEQEGPTAVTIPGDVAAHVLWHEHREGYPPGTFVTKLLDAWTSADDANRLRFAASWPEYGAALRLLSVPRGADQLRAMMAAPVREDQDQDPAEYVRCGKCLKPFDPADTRWDGSAQYNAMPYCRGCLDRCHDTEIADHRCPICDSEPPTIPMRAKVDGGWGTITMTRVQWNATRAAASR